MYLHLRIQYLEYDKQYIFEELLLNLSNKLKDINDFWVLRECSNPLEMNYSEYVTVINEVLMRRELSACLGSFQLNQHVYVAGIWITST